MCLLIVCIYVCVCVPMCVPKKLILIFCVLDTKTSLCTFSLSHTRIHTYTHTPIVQKSMNAFFDSGTFEKAIAKVFNILCFMCTYTHTRTNARTHIHTRKHTYYTRTCHARKACLLVVCMRSYSILL